jgi:hypothetical protein
MEEARQARRRVAPVAALPWAACGLPFLLRPSLAATLRVVADATLKISPGNFLFLYLFYY